MRFRRKTTILLISIALSSFSCTAQQVQLNLQRLLEMYKIPGISLAYLNDEGKWQSTTFGYRNTDSLTMVNDSTFFAAASLSKPVAGYIAILLAQAGYIELDKPLASYFQYEDLVGKNGYEEVTFEMVMSHTSGLPNWRGSSSLSFQQAPNSKFSYSGEGFLWMQKTIEHVLQQPFNQIAMDWLFVPLNMTNSQFLWSEKVEINHASPHNKMMFPTRKWKPEKENIAGSLQTTAGDYSIFLQELLHPTLLSDSLHMQMFNSRVTVKEYSRRNQSVSWALGIGVQETEDGLEYWHWGNNGNDRAFFAISPFQYRGFVYFTNSRNGLAMTEKLTNFFLGTDQPGYRWTGYKTAGKWDRFTSIFKFKKHFEY